MLGNGMWISGRVEQTESVFQSGTVKALQANARGAAYCQAPETLSFALLYNSLPSASSESPAVGLSKGLTLTDTLSLLWVEHLILTKAL